jgi:hypothetical protein
MTSANKDEVHNKIKEKNKSQKCMASESVED